MMTKKHYIDAAAIVKRQREYNGPFVDRAYLRSYADCLEGSFIEFFQADNPAFDKDRFQSACREVTQAPKNEECDKPLHIKTGR